MNIFMQDDRRLRRKKTRSRDAIIAILIGGVFAMLTWQIMR